MLALSSHSWESGLSGAGTDLSKFGMSEKRTGELEERGVDEVVRKGSRQGLGFWAGQRWVGVGRRKEDLSQKSLGKWGYFPSGRMGRSACPARGHCPLTWGYQECGQNPATPCLEKWGQEVPWEMVKETDHEGTGSLHSHWTPLGWLTWGDASWFSPIQAPFTGIKMTPTTDPLWTGQPLVILPVPKPLTPAMASVWHFTFYTSFPSWSRWGAVALLSENTHL